MTRIVTIPGAILSIVFMLYFLLPEIQVFYNHRRCVLALFGIFGTVSLGSAVWYFWPLIQDNVPFFQTAITKEFKLARTPSLGSPLRPIETTTDAYIAAHEHATVIFLPPLLEMFVLPNNGERKAKRHPIASYQDDRKWFDEEYLRRMFDPPQDENPPEYRVAELWSKNPDQWKWIGWREWSCFWALKDKFYYQEFENGIIFEVFPTGGIASESQIFTVANNGEWSSRLSSSVGAPACNEKTPRVGGVVVHGHIVKPKAGSN